MMAKSNMNGTEATRAGDQRAHVFRRFSKSLLKGVSEPQAQAARS